MITQLLKFEISKESAFQGNGLWNCAGIALFDGRCV